MTYRSSLLALILAGAVSISACDSPESGSIESGNFLAEVSGAVVGQVSGPGIIRFLPASEVNFGTRPAYFFVADDAGVRKLGITFAIPANTRPGTYRLVSVHPMDVGREFEVRVDWSVGDRTESFELNTKGTITIEAFPSDPDSLSKGRVMGSFDFSTQNRNGQKVMGQGSFDFHGS